MNKGFFLPYEDFKLTNEFINPPLFSPPAPNIIWGPFLGLLINTKRDNYSRIREWNSNSSEFVTHVSRVDSEPECLIEWWTHREHLFLITQSPRYQDGTLILSNREERLELWLRKPNKEEHDLYEQSRKESL
jgi:hypothetical protein